MSAVALQGKILYTFATKKRGIHAKYAAGDERPEY